ncbi:MAG: MFS transporter [Treponema sp.]|nr:MFS transporter [Treponema sp.]
MKTAGQKVPVGRNYYCIMLEGLFNLLGVDIIGMSTIVPLFLADFGASLSLIGTLPTAQGIIGAITPLAAGSFIARTRSKRRLSLTLNGLSRTAFLIIPLSLLLGLDSRRVIALFFTVILLYHLCQSITGISWNYLLGACVRPENRGKLLGTLFAFSGIISFLSGNIVRLLRESKTLGPSGRYAAIFALGGFLLGCSVLFFIPLKEQINAAAERKNPGLRAYLMNLAQCWKNIFFRRLIFTQAFSTMSTGINTFLYIIAQNYLRVSTEWISYMIIIQTVGVFFGGLLTGRISEYFGSKRTLIVVECTGLCIPALELAGLGFGYGQIVMPVAAFLIGFSRSGLMAFQGHLLELAEQERSIYYIVTKSILLLPFTFVSVLVGLFIERVSLPPVLFFQIAVAAAAIFCASRLKLFLYRKQNN